MSTQLASRTQVEGASRQYSDGRWQSVPIELPEEASLALFIDTKEVVTIQCTPEKLRSLVLGFLMSQGLISCPDDVALLRICNDDTIADVRLKAPVAVPARRVLTSGCGGGTVFDSGTGLSPVACRNQFTAAQVLSATRIFIEAVQGAGRRKGMHACALSDADGLLAIAEDIGRHNTVDKVWGECLLKGIDPREKILITTGRISSEMAVKAVKMQVPLVVSLNSATQRAVQIAAECGVTLVGYARGNRLTVFCGSGLLTSNAEAIPV